MKALSPSLYTAQFLPNSKIDCLIITGLKMQILYMCGCAPITSIERVCSDEIQCAANQCAVVDRHHQ